MTEIHPPAQWQGSTQQVPQKKKRTGLIIGAVVALVVLVGGVFLAMSLLQGSAPAATKGIPANAMAVVEVDLNPSVADKLAVKDLAEKFPALRDRTGKAGDDYKQALYELLGDDKPDYKSEVEPWLGDSIAVAAIGDTNNPQALISIQVKDKGKAEEFAKKQSADFSYVMVDDLLLLSPPDAAFDAGQLGAGTIADADDYKSDLARLDGSWLATGWGNEELARALASQPGLGIDTSALNNAAGRGAMGIKVSDGSLVTKVVGADGQPMEQAALEQDFVSSLPASGLFSMGVAITDEAVATVWDQLQSLDGQGMLAQLGLTSSDDLAAVLGNQLALSVGMSGDQPMIALKVKTADPAKHQDILGGLLQDLGLPQVQQNSSGDVVVTTFGMSTADVEDAADKLGDNDAFEKLTTDSKDASSVMWVDVPGILDILRERGMTSDDELLQNLEPITGVGITATNLGDGDSEGYLRIGTK